jgi:hypothetical protein
MIDIVYTYEVIDVTIEAKSMQILYKAEGRPDVLMGARLPYEGETLSDIVRMYTPIHIWEEQTRAVSTVEIGTSGIVSSSGTPNTAGTNTLEHAKLYKLMQIAAARYAYETSGVVVNGVLIQTDRITQATITSAFTSLSQGLTTAIDWKADNQWITIGLSEITAIAQAVVSHVQSAFSLEKLLNDQVVAATTIEEVGLVTWPQ